ncbi:hypothetical protein [Halopenitus persicus]|uniref:hypothetical protein n=1 Tax=Halopenitus persicus TaxID=1048396 RepID=UPI0015A408A0|nr:hypothetical protein [Halopenitus persicus]
MFYLTIPWGIMNVASQGEDLTTAEFMGVINVWATGLIENILLVVLLLFIAVLTYGPEVLDLVGGPERQNSPPRY